MQTLKGDLHEKLPFWSIPVALFLMVIAAGVFFGLYHVGLFTAENALTYGFGAVAGIAIFNGFVTASRNEAKLRAEWQRIATALGWTYEDTVVLEKENALKFNQGEWRRVRRALQGTLAGQPIRVLDYEYSRKSGKSSEYFYHTVFEVAFSGTFPHTFLKAKQHKRDPLRRIMPLPQVPLPAAIEKYYVLHAPKEYEIEAFEIWTPDTLAFLIDLGQTWDIELVDGELVLFQRGVIRTAEKLLAELRLLEQLVVHLAPKLNRMRLTPIGNLPHTL